MKPTSVIFIIVSVLLACMGLLLCMTAGNMANNQGIALFTQTGDTENNYTSSETFDGAELKKIVLDLNDVAVNVYGGATEDKIELVNFTDGTYDFTIGKSTLSLSDNAGLSSIVDLDTFKINFFGFRNYLNYFKYREKQRTVNLYLTDTAGVIIIDISVDSADVNIRDVYLECDYKVTVGTGDVLFNNVLTSSDIMIESTDDSKIDTEAVRAREIVVNTVTGYLTMSETTVTCMLEVKIKNGAVDYDRVEDDFVGFNVRLSAPNGTLRVWGDRYDDGYKANNYIPPEPETEPVTEPVTEPETDPDPDVTTAGSDTTAPAAPEEDEPKVNSILITVDNGSIAVS